MKRFLLILAMLGVTSPVLIAGYQWTGWLNRDNPSGLGDFETLSKFVEAGKACRSPRAIKCKTIDGRDFTAAHQVYTCNVNRGGICRNSEQRRGERCLNYKVKFLCPK